ncbi:MAG: hypothetical protein GW859_07125 [Sphingomonadales bacterium]|nr:hypothetical protein [Sphingomonadales bacterium]
MTDTNITFDHPLEREARLFAAHRNDVDKRAARTYIVADFEYIFDRDAHYAYTVREGANAHTAHGRDKVRWPFHHLSAASWITLRFLPGQDVPEIVGPVVLARDVTDERDMVVAFFDTLKDTADSVLVTWGGEVRDFAVLRHLACQYDLVLPIQLRETSPHARERLDLCRSTVVQAEPVHLQEYAAASSIPTKPSPSKEIGKLAERGEWDKVRDHVAADVLTTSVIALRHLASNGAIECDRAASVMAIADAAIASAPLSPFVTRDFKPWANARLRQAGLRGKVYRADAPRVRRKKQEEDAMT